MSSFENCTNLMGLQELRISDPQTWEKIKPILRHHLWRHRIPLNIGDYTTPGYLMMPNEWDACFLPATMDGKSFLDVGANDGYFSFEAERRKASEVVAVDIYRNTDFFSHTSGWPETGIRIARDVLQSKVNIVHCSILNLETLNGTFDYVFCNNVLAWIRNVDEAIRQLCNCCNETLVISDIFNTENPTHVTREKFSANTLSLQAVKEQLDRLGWEVYRKENRDEYQRLLWHALNFDTLDSDGPVKTYTDPVDKQVMGEAVVHQARGLMRANGMVFINKVGWVNEEDVRSRKQHVGIAQKWYRGFRTQVGLDRLLFNIRNKNKEKGLFLFARKKQ